MSGLWKLYRPIPFYSWCIMAKQKDAPAETVAEKPTQKEAVKQALAAGKDQPADGVAFVKEQFGITINNGAFSTLKSQIKKASGAKPSGGGRKPGSAASKPTGPGVVGNGKANPADLARSVKALVSQYGAEAVRDMASVFAE
jgi:hypothetical protein